MTQLVPYYEPLDRELDRFFVRMKLKADEVAQRYLKDSTGPIPPAEVLRKMALTEVLHDELCGLFADEMKDL